MNADVQALLAALRAAIEAEPSEAAKIALLGQIRRVAFDCSPQRAEPVDFVQWVPIEKVEANDYNPNSVAGKELTLLYHSIKIDGYTQPVVVVYDSERDKYVIVDGYHRYFVCREKRGIRERTHGMLPVVVLDKPLNARMAATVRHNRARGEHSIGGMGKLVFEMLDGGWDDAHICQELGLEAEELLKLKHITGFSALFKNVEYSRAWETRKMIRLRQAAEHANDKPS